MAETVKVNRTELKRSARKTEVLQTELYWLGTGALWLALSSEHWPDCSWWSAGNNSGCRCMVHKVKTGLKLLKKKKVFTGLWIPKTENTNCITTRVKRILPWKLQIPSVCLLGSLTVQMQGDKIAAPRFYLVQNFGFCWSPTKSRYRSQQEPIFLLKHLLLSWHSDKGQLEKRGIKSEDEFCYRIHFTAISLHSCTCISQPDIYSCYLM